MTPGLHDSLSACFGLIANTAGLYKMGFRQILIAVLTLNSAGCMSSVIRLQSPSSEEQDETEETIRLIGDVSATKGLNFVKVEAVGLVTGLRETGSDPPPSPQRAVLTNDIQTYSVPHPDRLLASPTTSLVLVRGYLPPGIQKGDHFDVEVRVPSKSDTASLEGGWLMQARMKEMAVLGNSIRQGHVLGLAQGDLLVDALVEGDDDPVSLNRARVLGGGITNRSRQLGLVIRGDDHSVKTTSMIGTTINRRFFGYRSGAKSGMATPKTDKFVELNIHPTYKQNIIRYVRVIQQMPIRLSAPRRVSHMKRLKKRLHDPATAASAALGLEALGKDSLGILATGLQSPDPEIRFLAAEAMAYLNDRRAIPVLSETARNESALRWHALNALAIIEDADGFQELNELLHTKSAETRYGAIRAMRTAHPTDRWLRGELIGEGFHLLKVPSAGPNMVHISLRHRPEIVIFGNGVELQAPFLLFTGKRMMIDGRVQPDVRITHFGENGENYHDFNGAQLYDIIRAAGQMGATYAELVQMIQIAKQEGYLDARVMVDAVPEPGRVYRRNGIKPSFAGTTLENGGQLFRDSPDLSPPADAVEKRTDSEMPVIQQPRTFFDRIIGRIAG